MFEKEAEEYTVEHHCKNCWMKDADGDSKCTGLDFCGRNKDWQRGAESGYNKAKEELEKENAELKEKLDFFLTEKVDGKEYRPKWELEKLEKENAELKAVKIPQLERKIASIRGCHRVDLAKLKARLEQVERQKQEIAELKAQNEKLKKQFEPQDVVELMNEIEAPYKLQEAKEIIRDLLFHLGNTFIVSYTSKEESITKAEQFLKEVE